MPGKRIKNSGHTQVFNLSGSPKIEKGREVWLNRKGKKILKIPARKPRRRGLRELIYDAQKKFQISKIEAAIYVLNDPTNGLTDLQRIKLAGIINGEG